jgi:putative DNA primase/helicase
MSDRGSLTRKPMLARIALTGREVMEMELRQPAQLLSPWLRRGSIVLLHAQPKAGKTYFAIKTAIAVSRGESFLGWQPARPGRSRRVLYIDAEMPLWLMQKRLGQLAYEEDDNLTILSREQSIACDYAMPDFGSKKGQEELDVYIDHVKPDLIVLDSLSALIRTGAENERESWLPIEEWLQRQRARDRAVLMVHHQGKSGLQRGTSSRIEVIDAELSLSKHPAGLRVKIEKLRDHDEPINPIVNARLEIDNGSARWRKVKPNMRDVQLSETRAAVLTLLKDGLKPSGIAKRLSKDRKTVYGHQQALIAAGMI